MLIFGRAFFSDGEGLLSAFYGVSCIKLSFSNN